MKNRDDELLNYLDGSLPDERARALRVELEHSTELRSRLDELQVVTEALRQKGSLIHPSSNFTHRVMANLHRLPATSGLSPRNGLLLLCGILVAVGALGFLLSAGVFDNMSGTLAVPNTPVAKELIKNPIPSVAINAKWIINGIVVLTLGLSFVLLDRTVLRPLFNKRSHLQY